MLLRRLFTDPVSHTTICSAGSRMVGHARDDRERRVVVGNDRRCRTGNGGRVERGVAVTIYNIVDDRPQSFGDYIRELQSLRWNSAQAVAGPAHWSASPRPTWRGRSAPHVWLPLSNRESQSGARWTPIVRWTCDENEAAWSAIPLLA